MIKKNKTFQFNVSKSQLSNTEEGQVDLLAKLEAVEKFSSQYGEVKEKKKNRRSNKNFYSDLSYFKPLETRFPNFSIQVQNDIKTSSIRTYGSYFEIFLTYTTTLLNLVQRGSLEKSARIQILCEQKGRELVFSIHISELKFAREDLINLYLKKSNKETSHLLTPFNGKVKSFVKRQRSRRVSEILVQFRLTPLRQHLSNQHFTLS